MKLNQSNANTDVEIETDAAEVIEINASMINDINDFDDQHLSDPTESKNTKSIYVSTTPLSICQWSKI